MKEKPNILWYCTDQQRYDTIRALGNTHIRTPNLDHLCDNGIAFLNAYTQSPICTPSRASFLTGRYPAAHHVQRNGNDYFPSNEVLVTKLLAEHGYDCGLAGKFHLSRSEGRVEKRPPEDGYGFFQWSHHPYPDWPKGNAYNDWLQEEKKIDPQELYRGIVGQYYGAGVPEEYHQTTWCTEMAMRFIERKREGPWLMSLNPFDPHPQFDPPPEYLDRYNPEDIPYPLFQESDLERQKQFFNIDQQSIEAVNPYTNNKDAVVNARDIYKDENIDYHSVPPKNYDVRKIIAAYYAMVELIDYQFGRLLDFLESIGQLDNTIVIFMSDHGELLGDHGLLYKGCRFFESLVHVPLIISCPERFQQGFRSSALVELVDIAPTLLEEAGISVPYYMQGASLSPMLSGKADMNHHKDYVLSEYWDAAQMMDNKASHGSMYFDGRYKCIVYHTDNIGELFDLKNDPGEFNNVWDDPVYNDIKQEMVLKHFNAIMQTNGTGIFRSAKY